MGGSAPADSTATGNLGLVAGSTSETGTFRLLTRGVDQTAEYIETTSINQSMVYSRLGHPTALHRAKLVCSGPSQRNRLISHCPFSSRRCKIPIQPSSMSAKKSLNNLAAQHIRVWNTFSSQPGLSDVARFSIRDIRLDSSSHLPLKISYARRYTASADALLVEVFFSDYRNVLGYQYPFAIKKSLNGTPWVAMTVQDVTFNTGLTDNDFPIQ